MLVGLQLRRSRATSEYIMNGSTLLLLGYVTVLVGEEITYRTLVATAVTLTCTAVVFLDSRNETVTRFERTRQLMYPPGGHRGVFIGVARGCMGARAPPGRRKKWGPNLKRKVVSAPSEESKRPFLGNWGDLAGERGYLGSLSVF